MLQPLRDEAMLRAVAASTLLRLGARVLAAVSGGPDSTALLIALHETGHDVVAAHYDHALREGSDAVAARVAELCTSLGVELITERRTAPLPRGSLQAAARTLRYEFLERARADSGAVAVALAHTADDVVEGAVIHLERGCGLAGMRGMPGARDVFVRPMLDVWRADVRSFLERRGVSSYEDPANSELRFERVRVRRTLLPALERDRPGIVRRLHAASRVAGRLHETAVALASEAHAGGPLTAAALVAMPEPVAIEVLKALYVEAGGAEPGLSRSHFRSMLDLARPGEGGRGVDLPGGLRFRIVGNLVQIVDSSAGRRLEQAAMVRLEVSSCPGCADPEAAHLRGPAELSVGFRRPGLRLRPVGGRGTRKLQDVLVDAHIPREDRDTWPLVFDGGRLAWVPGVALDAGSAAVPGERSLHVRVIPMPVPSRQKVVKLKAPKEPSRSA